MKSSTQDKIESAAKRTAGVIKEKTGKATDNPRLREEGKNDSTRGKVQLKIGDIKKVFNR